MYAQVSLNLKIQKLDHAFTYKIPEELKEDIVLGSCVIVPFGQNNKILEGFVLGIIEVVNYNKSIKSIIDIKRSNVFLNKNMNALAKKIKNFYLLPYASIFKLLYLSIGISKSKNKNFFINITKIGLNSIKNMRKSKKKIFLKSIANKQILLSSINSKEISKKDLYILLEKKYINFIEFISEKKYFLNKLNKEQLSAFKKVEESIDKARNDIFLLFGVPGSGKTEVYFHSIEKVLRKGKQVLVLLPEISLTEQMISRFEKVFPENVEKWHSQISKNKKHEIINEIERKNKNILIGSRSAVFAPFKELGLIIVDEEHDISYYQEKPPTYNAKTIALMRGNIENIPIILGSGTPSVDSYFLFKKGVYRLLALKEKFYGINFPKIDIVDMSEELKSGNFTILSKVLINNIKNVLDKKEQVLLFLNRKGFYNFIICKNCGFVLKCDNCDISLSYHYNSNKMICHHCGKEKQYFNKCPKCLTERMRGIGFGTEQIVLMIRKIFKYKVVARLDNDFKKNNQKKQLILEDFKKGDIDILVGTQLIAKGIDFPNVSLVGILFGDSSLNLPDYRANEWTFQLLLQLIGRTGRRNIQGRVFLQTYRPFDMIFKKIISQNYKGFYAYELNFRKKFNYPPFVEIFRLQVQGINEEIVIKQVWKLYNQLNKYFKRNEIFLPKSNILKKIQKKYRWNILFKIKQNKERIEEIENYFKLFLIKIHKEVSGKVLVYLERNPKNLT